MEESALPAVQALQDTSPNQLSLLFFGRDWSLLPQKRPRPVLRDCFEWALGEKTEPRRYPLTENPADPELASETELRALPVNAGPTVPRTGTGALLS